MIEFCKLTFSDKKNKNKNERFWGAVHENTIRVDKFVIRVFGAAKM
jgi:hypothetical protein